MRSHVKGVVTFIGSSDTICYKFDILYEDLCFRFPEFMTAGPPELQTIVL